MYCMEEQSSGTRSSNCGRRRTGRRPGDKAVSLLASTGVRIDLMLQVVMTIIFYYIHILVLVARISS